MQQFAPFLEWRHHEGLAAEEWNVESEDDQAMGRARPDVTDRHEVEAALLLLRSNRFAAMAADRQRSWHQQSHGPVFLAVRRARSSSAGPHHSVRRKPYIM